MSLRIAASIILYDPDLNRLQENVKAIEDQVEAIVLIANGDSCKEALEIFRGKDKIHVVENQKNVGIAKALNQAMEFGYEHGYDFVLTLDQDSVSPEHMVERLAVHGEDPKVAIVAPCNTDRNKPSADLEKSGHEYVKRCITSASLTSVAAWKAVGGFTDELFIDYVDFDYCAKLLRAGYKMVKDYDVILLHEVGHIRMIQVLGRSIRLYNHSPFRLYYYTRNVRYVYKTYPDVVDVKWEKRNLFNRCVTAILFEKHKWKNFVAVMRGLRDTKKLWEK